MLTEGELPRRIRQSYRKLLDLPFDRGPLLILTHHNPDPDCLASSAALQHLLKEKRGIEVTAAYTGVIGRAENRAMVRLLDLPVQHALDIDFDAFPYIALIDAQPRTGNTAVPENRSVDIVIDHHPLREQTKDVPFYIVAPELGATATLVTEYLRRSKVDIPRDLATALVYAIRTETHDLGREASKVDVRAYEYLLPRADSMKLSAISRPVLERGYYAQLQLALGSLLIGQRTAICRMQEVNDPDFVPEMADLIVRMEGLDWVLAWGRHGARLYLSIRTNELDASAGSIMQQLLEGVGRGGGHGMRAGGAIELDSPETSDLESLLIERMLSISGESAADLRPFAEVAGRAGDLIPNRTA